MLNKIELLAPAGNLNKLKTAFHFGADACYLGLNKFGLRAFAGNFSFADLNKAVKLAHSLNKKIYVTLNIYAKNNDFKELVKTIKMLEKAQVDAVLVSDIGVLEAVKNNSNLAIHVSTQANVTNKYAAMKFVEMGASRVVLARELSISEVKEIATYLKGKAEVEVFVHGAMCIAYSGRCLLSNYLTGRESNRGACVQACRWCYNLTPTDRKDEQYEIGEDENGSYILNSKDLCLVGHLKELVDAGVTSLKIEGRMKSEYYVGTVVNTYRRVLDNLFAKKPLPQNFDAVAELEKTSHRKFTTGFMFNDEFKEYYLTSRAVQTHEFIAEVLENSKNDKVKVMMRNAFKLGDELEILSTGNSFLNKFKIKAITNSEGESLEICNRVQDVVTINCPFEVFKGDLLRTVSKN